MGEGAIDFAFHKCNPFPVSTEENEIRRHGTPPVDVVLRTSKQRVLTENVIARVDDRRRISLRLKGEAAPYRDRRPSQFLEVMLRGEHGTEFALRTWANTCQRIRETRRNRLEERIYLFAWHRGEVFSKANNV